ncbi:MAG: hypothetical protein J6A53_06235 [Clostridia bacterium]|nr:hypothetical protein [Clostridia bacterium]
MEENNQDFEIQDSNSAKKLKALGVDMNEKIHSSEDEITKGNLWDNIWYRYKWAIIIGSIMLVIAVILIVQVAMKKDDDIKIAYVGPAYIADTETRDSLINIFSLIAKDYNGDGEKIINITSNVILNSEQITEEDEEGRKPNASQVGQNQQYLNTFIQQMQSGDFTIYLVDSKLYEESLKGVFVNIEEALSMDIPDEMKYDDYSIYLSKTEFGSYYKGLDKLPDDTIALVLQKTVFADEDDYNNSIEFLKNMINFKAPQN